MSDKMILVTGANGNIGSNLVKKLADSTSYKILAVARNKEKIYEMIENKGIINKDKILVMSYEELFQKKDSSNIYAVVHLAFSRANRPYAEIAESLDCSKNLYRWIRNVNIFKVVYISSQSVYGAVSEWRSEQCPAAPQTVYSMAKYAGEKLLEEMFENIYDVEYTSLRLDFVIQSQKLVYTLCRNAKIDGVLNLKVGKQTFSYIDESDVVEAIVKLLDYDGKWKNVYNVGHNKVRYSLSEIADIVVNTAEKHGQNGIKVNIENSDAELGAGMDSSLFCNDTGWKPEKDIYKMVEDIYESIC